MSWIEALLATHQPKRRSSQYSKQAVPSHQPRVQNRTMHRVGRQKARYHLTTQGTRATFVFFPGRGLCVGVGRGMTRNIRAGGIGKEARLTGTRVFTEPSVVRVDALQS